MRKDERQGEIQGMTPQETERVLKGAVDVRVQGMILRRVEQVIAQNAEAIAKLDMHGMEARWERVLAKL
ncbi:MAG: hypothetical protein DMG24_00240 [Acidobacteria bacterium]|nr:MAG: hypothetical protein DMG24_00240 [Acidobacteriota bacterium]